MASLEFDAEAHAIYIKLKLKKIDISEPLADNIIIDVSKDGDIVGIEILLPREIDEKLKRKIEESMNTPI